jgi:hypothetical protein
MTLQIGGVNKFSVDPNGGVITSARGVHGSVVLTYGPTIAPDASTGNSFVITATNATAFTISNPLNPVDGQRISFTIRNTAGVALGAITWGTAFKMAAFTAPATGNSRSIEFRYDNASGFWVQLFQSAADIPN